MELCVFWGPLKVYGQLYYQGIVGAHIGDSRERLGL